MITNSQKRLIHVARRQLGLDDEECRALLRRCAGVESSSDLDHSGFDAVMRGFLRRGFRSTSPRRPLGDRDWMGTDPQLALIRKLWCEWSTDGTEKGLRTWLRTKFKVDDLRFLTLERAPGVIAALRQMVAQKANAGDPAA